MPEAGDGPGWDSETMTGWARILERAPSREIGTRGIAYLKGGAQRRASQHNRLSASTKRCTDFVQNARPGESRCPGCRRFRTRWPPSVTVVALTGAVKAVTGAVKAVTDAVTAVTWGRDPVPDVTGNGPAPCRP
jgi:hypothetical protein